MLYIVEKIIIAIVNSVDIEMIKTIVFVVVYIITQYLSVIIAACVLSVTIWQGWQNRKHNRLSVKPFLNVLGCVSRSGNIKDYTVTLVNHGVGPAIIKNFELLFEGKSVSNNHSESYKDFLNKKIKPLKGLKGRSFEHRSEDSVIKVGEEIILWKFKCERDEDIEDIEKIKIRIKYQSIYQDEIFFHPPKK